MLNFLKNIFDRSSGQQQSLIDAYYALESAVIRQNALAQELLSHRYRFRNEPLVREDYVRVYGTSAVVFACVSRIARSMASLPHQIFKRGHNGKSIDVTYTDDRFKIFKRPCLSRQLTNFTFREIRYVYQELTGEFYAEKVRDNAGRLIEWFPLRPDWIKPIADARQWIREYEYQVDGHRQLLDRDRVWSFLYFNPVNDVRGQSPLTTLVNQINTHENITHWFETLSSTQGTMNFIVRTPGSSEGPAFKRFRERFKQAMQKFKNLEEPLTLEQGAQLDKINLSPTDAGIEKLHKLTFQDILAAYNVPPLLVGIYENANYNTAKSQLRLFRDVCLAPRLLMEQEHTDAYLLPELSGDYRHHIKYDLTALDLFSIDPLENAERYGTAWRNNGCTLNEYRTKGLGLEPVGNGDVFIEEYVKQILPRKEES